MRVKRDEPHEGLQSKGSHTVAVTEWYLSVPGPGVGSRHGVLGFLRALKYNTHIVQFTVQSVQFKDLFFTATCNHNRRQL